MMMTGLCFPGVRPVNLNRRKGYNHMDAVIRPKKNLVWFRFPADPVNLCATQIILWAWDVSTHTPFLQFFRGFAQTAHYSRSVSLATRCLLFCGSFLFPPLLLLLQTWHLLWVWPADNWLFCLKSRLSFCVRFIVQLVLVRRKLARFIDTGTNPQTKTPHWAGWPAAAICRRQLWPVTQ